MKESASRKRWFRWFFVLLLLSPAIALLGINAAFLIPKVRGKAISVAGKRFGLGGTADSLTYTPWGGVDVSNFKVGDGSLIRAEAFSLDLHETKLFSRELSVDDVVLEGATFTFIYQPPEPAPVVAASAPAKPAAALPQEPAPQVTIVAQEKPPSPQPAAKTKREAPKRWSKSIGSVRMEDVRFAVRNRIDGDDLILADGFSFISPAEGEGEMSLGMLAIAGHEVASDISGELARGDGKTFHVTQLSGTALGAVLSGALQLAPEQPGLPFVADLTAKALGHPEIGGTADAALKLQGRTLNPLSWNGQFQIQAPEKLSIAGFPSAEFIDAQLQARIQAGTLQITDARAIASRSGSLSLRASGHATLSGDLALNLRPYIQSDSLPVVQERLASVFSGQKPPFALLPPSPLAFTDFAIRGKATDPQLYFSSEHPPLSIASFLKNLQSAGPEP